MSLSPHAKMQIGRLVRLVVTTLAGSALVVNFINAWAVRYPLLAVLIGLVEVAWREFKPVTPLSTVASVPPPGGGRQPGSP